MIKITKLKQIEEHVLVHSLQENDVEKYINESKLFKIIDDEYQLNLYEYKNQSLYFLLKGEDICSYCIIQNNSGFLWLLEIRALIPNNGYGQKIIIELINSNIKPLFLDVNLTIDSIKMIEKMIKSNLINVKVANLTDGLFEPVDNDTKNIISMYDVDIPNINRTKLSTDEAKNKVWVLENIQNKRSGLLSQYIEYIK